MSRTCTFGLAKTEETHLSPTLPFHVAQCQPALAGHRPVSRVYQEPPLPHGPAYVSTAIGSGVRGFMQPGGNALDFFRPALVPALHTLPFERSPR